MHPFVCTLAAAMLLFPSGDDADNPWKEKVAGAVRKAETAGDMQAWADALDVAWRADDWQAGLSLARQAAQRWPASDAIQAAAVRALWRAGVLEEAEKLAARISADTSDTLALSTLITVDLARGDAARAARLADRLQRIGPQTAYEAFAVIAARMQLDRYEGLGKLLRAAEKQIDPKNGYPDIYLKETADGLAEFFEAVGPRPLNTIVATGAAPMPQIPLIGLPGVDCIIDGHGPYRLIVDTGGSITLSIDTEIAEEIGLKSVATAIVRGVSGTQPCGQAVVESLEIGGIRCGRVATRIFDFPAAVKSGAVGIIGTGMFGKGRMTLDFAAARLVIEPSSDQPAAGREVGLRIPGDGKLITPIRIQGEYGLALLDSGADMAALSPARIKQLFPDHAGRSWQAGGIGVGEGGTAGLGLAPGVTVEIMGRTKQNYAGLVLEVLDSVFSPFIGVQTTMLVGMPLFREMRSCTVDFERVRMWVQWLDESE